MHRSIRVLLGAVAVLLVAVAGFWLVARLSGGQSPVDAVAAAQETLGIPLESSFVPTNGIRLHVVQAGPADGPPVVLLHGYPEFWWAWHRQMGVLAAAGFRAIAPDQRGYNASEKPERVEAYRLEQLRLDIAGLVEALGHRDAFLAGHDWGGGVAWQVAIHHPERVRKLVIFNTPHPLAVRDAELAEGERSIGWYRTFFQLPVLPELVARLGNWGLLVDALRASSREGALSEADLDLYRYAWDRDGAMRTMIHWYRAAPPSPPSDPRVRVPTRMVLAGQDVYIPPSLGRASLAYCDEASVVEIPDASHWVLHDDPGGTSRILVDFFRAR